MEGLAQVRPIFHSEADFQHALAWQIHATCPDAGVRLEFDPKLDDGRMAIDIWVRFPGEQVAIELKYGSRKLLAEHDGETFALKDQAAGDLKRYDFLKDVERLEACVRRGASSGVAVMLTNDPLYWESPTRRTVDAAFRIHEGCRIPARPLRWGRRASPGTTKSREHPIRLQRAYDLRWRDYSAFGDGRAERFRYLAVPVR